MRSDAPPASAVKLKGVDGVAAPPPAPKIEEPVAALDEKLKTAGVVAAAGGAAPNGDPKAGAGAAAAAGEGASSEAGAAAAADGTGNPDPTGLPSLAEVLLLLPPKLNNPAVEVGADV